VSGNLAIKGEIRERESSCVTNWGGRRERKRERVERERKREK
jgi:hypothetical protein